ncbi:kinase-like domain-containing protein [Hyaloraphidium curvatum]|nr:kinase-like domain-containing protein [Hyaloraphidium curvatum]
MALSLQETFEWGRILGRGSFSEVVYVTERKTGHPYAMKVINKAILKPKDVKHLLEEIALQRRLSHPNIIVLHNVFESASKIYLQMDFAAGGELFTRVAEKGFLTEEEARAIIGSVLNAVAHLHSLSIVHRDLKPENILFATIDNDGPEELSNAVRISDFGFAKHMPPETLLRTQLGSLAYAAPELLRGRPYDAKVDLWSTGVITFVLLSGTFPFSHPKESGMFDAITNGRFSMVGENWVGVSEEAKDFVRRLLVQDPTKRPTAEEALRHPWLLEPAEKGIDKLDDANVRFPTLPPSAIARARKVAVALRASIDAQSIVQNAILERVNESLANPEAQDALKQGLASHFSYLAQLQVSAMSARRSPSPQRMEVSLGDMDAAMAAAESVQKDTKE